ncbi:DNA-3-methyladenine glycosylase family protein [Burkholderia sp. USMB20]|uniref:DNA-3-methyladenine glycosylase family protein n=1 Tax=Burkholderia sp. USMB20 TaxID=1571773 RepID=UPI0005CE28BF|nr:DNA-3-methyladenine glycosylase [Burkholderia sp. USMB20]TGN96321.1 DNA-3-methyladenine glycosylase 2 family protein [Burkholderia sp. USMB20]
MATARKAPVRRATPLAARPAAKRAPAAKADATRAVPNGALNGHAKPARAKGVDAVQPEVAMAAADAARKVRAADAAVDGADGVVRPAYWDKASADLVKRDRILKKLIPKFGPAHLVKRGDPFVTLARSVVGQQISVPSAQALWARIEDACPKLAPQPVIRLGADKLIACGLSKRKTEYILDLAQHFVSGALHVDKWTSMDDEDVIAELTQIRGISRWTAEMFLIFNLSRPDVLPLDDPGLIRAISVNYFSGEPVTRSEAREVAANWEPWRTVATWYMWRSLDAPDADAD